MRLFFFGILFFLNFSVIAEENWQKIIATKPVLQKMTDATSMTLWSAGLISTLMVKPSDDQIRESWKDHQLMSHSISSAGDFLGSLIPGGAIIGGQYFFDGQEENWRSHARALIWESLIVTSMKYSFGRQRPGGSQSHLSFPSGHTAAAFATATALTYSYGWKAAVAAYPIATLVGLSRLADDAHWGSDVVAGAFVGFITARSSVLEETQQEAQSKLSIMPILSPEHYALTCVYSF